MPYVRVGISAQKRDPIKGLILEYMKQNEISISDLANRWGISRATCSKRINQTHSDNWFSDAKKICKEMRVPIEELRNALRY